MSMRWITPVCLGIPALTFILGLIVPSVARAGEPRTHDSFFLRLSGGGGYASTSVNDAGSPAISFLIDPHELRNVLQASGLRDTHWEDKTNVSSEFFIGVMKGLKHGPPPVGIHLVMGESARVKLGNMARNLEEERVTILIAMLEKPAG